jgi:GNAT superfamily N-acetyltransferase
LAAAASRRRLQRAGYLRAAENVFYDQRPRPGLAKKLALLALDYAREQGFKRCYLETTAFLTEAIGLYEHLASNILTVRWAAPATWTAKCGC